LAREGTGNVLVEDSQTISSNGMGLIISEFTQLDTDGANGSGSGRSFGMRSQIEPETVSVRTSTMVSSPDVVGVGNPETSGGLISVEKGLRRHGVHDQIVFDQIVGFNTVLNENGVTLHSVSNIVLDLQVMDTVNGDGSVVSVMDGITIDVRVVDITDQMVMDGISTKVESLTRLSDLSVGDSGNRGIVSIG
jgi:hypothetical protein